MADRSSEYWYPAAAYLYALHLDGPALAWEYLRRHPDYRQDWLRCRRRSNAALRWGLRLLENPALDARDAHPAWFPDHDAVLQLYPDVDPPLDTEVFTLWRLPGHKHLIHDGRRLILVARWPGACLRFAVALTWPRPSLAPLLELHTLQALDATLAGASLREVAEGLFGADAVANDWHADSALRARVRRLVRRGNRLMQSGYRHLAQLPPVEQGRAAVFVKRP